MEEQMYEEEPTSPDVSADHETLTHKRRRGRPPKVKTILQLQQQEGDTKRRKRNLLGEKSGKKLGRPPKKKPLGSADSKIEAGAANITVDDSNSHKQEAQVFVGQTVKGVVDGSFDAGYLVSVRVGDSDTVYRGVIFGPGLSLPLNKDNDVAPKVKMNARQEEAEAAPPTTPPPAPSVVAAHSSSTHIDDSASMYHGNQHNHHQTILQVQETLIPVPALASVPAPASAPPAALAPNMGFVPRSLNPSPSRPYLGGTSSHVGHGYGGSPPFHPPTNYGGLINSPRAGAFMYPTQTAHTMPLPSAASAPNPGFYSPQGLLYPFHVPTGDLRAGYHPQFAGLPRMNHVRNHSTQVSAGAGGTMPTSASTADCSGTLVPPF